MDDDQAYGQLRQLLAVIGAWASDGRVFVVGPCSRLASDDALTHPYAISDAVEALVESAQDHLQAIRALILDAGVVHMAAPFTLARSALESAAQAVWLLSPAEQSVRVKRRLQMAVTDARDRDSLVRSVTGDGHTPDVLDDRLATLARLAETAGHPASILVGRFPGAGSMVREAGSHADMAGDHARALWQLGSGYAHGRMWPLLTGGTLEEIAGRLDAQNARLDVDVRLSTVVTITGAAVRVLDHALRLRQLLGQSGSAVRPL